jgi:hypothetical protein
MCYLKAGGGRVAFSSKYLSRENEEKYEHINRSHYLSLTMNMFECKTQEYTLDNKAENEILVILVVVKTIKK